MEKMFSNEEWDDNDIAKSLKLSLFSESKIPGQGNQQKPKKKRNRGKSKEQRFDKQENSNSVRMVNKGEFEISTTKRGGKNDPKEERVAPVPNQSVKQGRKRGGQPKPNTSYQDGVPDEKKGKGEIPLETEKNLSDKNISRKSCKKLKLSELPDVPDEKKSKLRISLETAKNITDKNISRKSWKKLKLSELLADYQNKSITEQKNSASDCSKQSNSNCSVDLCDAKQKSKKMIKQASTCTSRSEDLRKKVTDKLQSAQFRFINEQLYSCSSKEAWNLFRSNHNAYLTYHQGFSSQVSKWPVNPLDMIISFIKKRPSHWIVADFGCGDARLASSVKNKVHSFDLVAENDRVTVADIAHVPLEDDSIDVAVFCLSLMGTNLADFLVEANRTLKLKGWLKIAEVASRFSSISKFVYFLRKLGFELEQQNKENTHFYVFDFRKVRNSPRAVDTPPNLLKPCLYKKR